MSKEQLRKFAAQLKVHAKAVPEVAGQATEAPAPGSGRATAEATSDQGGESADPPEDKGDDPWAGQEAPPPPDDSGIPF